MGALAISIILGFALGLEAFAYYKSSVLFWIWLTTIYLLVYFVFLAHSFTVGRAQFAHPWRSLAIFVQTIKKAVIEIRTSIIEFYKDVVNVLEHFYVAAKCP